MYVTVDFDYVFPYKTVAPRSVHRKLQINFLLWSQSNENDKTSSVDRLLLISNFYVLKLWLPLITKFGGGILIENQN